MKKTMCGHAPCRREGQPSQWVNKTNGETGCIFWGEIRIIDFTLSSWSTVFLKVKQMNLNRFMTRCFLIMMSILC